MLLVTNGSQKSNTVGRNKSWNNLSEENFD
jgi:hypothetical protein